jgi:tetratricopeptide (TPR) repeat protein
MNTPPSPHPTSAPAVIVQDGVPGNKAGVGYNLPGAGRRRARRTVFGGKRLRTPILALLALAIALGLAAVACYPAYNAWRRDQPVREAQAFLKRGDFERAESSARRALDLNRNNLDAMRVLAEVYDHGDFAKAISWRKAVTDHAPTSLDDRIALANEYLRVGATSAASLVLDGIQGDNRNTIKFHAAAAKLAVTLNRPIEAEAHFAELIKLSPDNKVWGMDMALLRIDSSSPAERNTARGELENFSKDEELQLPALRALIKDARRAGARPEIFQLRLSDSASAPTPESDDPADSHRLLSLVHALARSPRAELQDRILVAEFLQETGDFGFDSYLTRLQNGTVAQPQGIEELILWMNRHGMARQALTWAGSLPKNESVLPEVQFAVADSLIRLQDWDGLKSHIIGAEWQGLEIDRLAIVSALYRQEGLLEKARQTLTESADEVRDDPTILAQMATFCQRYHWDSEAREYLSLMRPTAAGNQSLLSKAQAALAKEQAALAIEPAGLDKAQAALAKEQAALAIEPAGLDKAQAALAKEQAALAIEPAGLDKAQAALAKEQAVLATEPAGLDKEQSAGNAEANAKAQVTGTLSH